MYALLVEYDPGTNFAARWAHRLLATSGPGYRRHLALQPADRGGLIDLFLFATAAGAAATLASARRLADPGGARDALALLEHQGGQYGEPTVVLRRLPGPGCGWRRECLHPAAPATALW